MKKLILLITFVFSIALQSNSANLPDSVEKEIWSDSWPIYASEFYNGNQYVVQLCRTSNGTNKKWEMRLIELKINDDVSLSDNRYWVLDDGDNKDPDYKHYNAAMKEYNGKLYIYIHCNSQNYFFAFQTDNHSKENLTQLTCPVKRSSSYFASCMVTYRNSLAIITIQDISKITDKIRVYYTRDTDPSNSSAVWNTVESEPRFYATQVSYGDGDFDATSWIGVRKCEIETEVEENGQKIKKKEETDCMVEELIIGQLKGGQIQVHHFDGEWENFSDAPTDSSWIAESISLPITNKNDVDYGFGLKIVEGQIPNNGAPTDTLNNPLQIVVAFEKNYTTGNLNQRQIRLYQYNPADRSFSKSAENANYNYATNLPYGKFGACSVSVPIPGVEREDDGEVQTYQRYISIFRGAIDGHFKNHHHYAMIKSNQIKVRKYNVPTDSLLETPEGRQYCTLVGVIEGAPPTVADNAQMYNTLCGAMGNISSLQIGSSESNKISSENSHSFGFSAMIGYDTYSGIKGKKDNGPNALKGFSAMAGVGYEVKKSVSKEEVHSSEITTGIVNSDNVSASLGRYYYIVPRLDMYIGQMYTPDGKYHLAGFGDVMTYVKKGSIAKYYPYLLDSITIDERIRIEEPLKLESWLKRGNRLINNYGDFGEKIFDESISTFDNKTISFKTTRTNTSSNSTELTTNLEVKGHIFQYKSGNKMTKSSSTSSTVGKDISVEIKHINSSYLGLEERDRKAWGYVLEGYYLNDPNDPVTKIYYDDLVKRQMMNKGDTPFIIAWNVSEISYANGLQNLVSSGVDELDENKHFSTNAINGGIEVNSNDDLNIEIFNTAGMKVYSRTCQKGTTMVELPKGLYIVRGNHKSIKIIVR